MPGPGGLALLSSPDQGGLQWFEERGVGLLQIIIQSSEVEVVIKLGERGIGWGRGCC